MICVQAGYKRLNGRAWKESKIMTWLAWEDRGNNEFITSNRDYPSLCAQFAIALWFRHFSWINYWRKECRGVSASPCLNWKGKWAEKHMVCVRRLTTLLLQVWNNVSQRYPPGHCLGLGQAACIRPSSKIFPGQIQVMDPVKCHPSF